MRQIDQKQLPLDAKIWGELVSFFLLFFIFYNEHILFYNQWNII